MKALCSSTVIELQEPTESFSTLDYSFFAFSHGGLRKNKGVADALMIAFKVVMGGILLEHMVKRPFAEKNHSIQAFGFHRQDKALSIRVQIRRTRWQLHRFYLHRT